MIDIHTHILPNIDDGCESVEEAVELLKEEYKYGVKKVILTPHYRKNEFDYTKQNLIDKFNNFVSQVKDISEIPSLYLGQEIFCESDIYNKIESNKIITLNNSKAILIEFSTVDDYDIADFVYNLKVMGYIPIIAHIERYKYLDEIKIANIKSDGGLIQVNAETLIGIRGLSAKKYALKLIKLGLVDFISSDMHYGRINTIKKAYKVVKRKFGSKKAEELFNLNAEKYIFN